MNESLNRFFKGFVYAKKGIIAAIADQRNLKVQIGIALITVGAGFYFQITDTEWCVILLTIALVIGLEMMNSAAENLVDLVTREYSALAGKVKDIAAGAVLIASIIAVIIGVLIFRKYLLI
jgi:diacylglycerol kinase